MNAGNRNSKLQETAVQELEGRRLGDDDKDESNSMDSEKQSVERRVKKVNRREPANEVQARQRAIGTELQRMFDAVASEPVPAEMLDLLRRIETQHSE